VAVSPQISIIVPTYNERDNLISLIERIDMVLSPITAYEIVIVDDDSPDGTAAIARSASERYPVKLVVRQNTRGLATAVVEGFRQAKSPALTVIDADLQHPPELLPRLLEGIWNGADVVIASRYIPGGSIPRWGISRKLASKFAALLARIILPAARGIADPLSGFFAFNRKAIEKVDLNPIGYKILLEILAIGNYNKVTEIPYAFSEREKGETKYNFKEISNYLKHVFNLAWRTGEVKRLFKFILVGTTGIVVNEGLLYVLTEFAGLFYLISSVIAVQAAILNNFVWNHLWTFADRRQVKESIWYRLGKFELVSIAGKLTNILILFLAVTFLDIHYLIANLLGIAAGFVVNFTANNIWTWRK
jgi:dolichol-phosphate mannosyltransferase